MTYFEESFTQFVKDILGEMIRQQVAEHLEILRGPAWVSKKEAARLMGCSPRTVARHVALRRLTTSKPLGSPMLIERASIDALIEESKMPKYQWERPWLRQPRLNPHKSPAHVAAGKLGHERRRQAAMGIHDDITMQIIAERKEKEAAKEAKKGPRKKGS